MKNVKKYLEMREISIDFFKIGGKIRFAPRSSTVIFENRRTSSCSNGEEMK